MQPRWLVTQLEELDYQVEYQADLSQVLVGTHRQQQHLSDDNLALAKTDAFAVQEVLQKLIQEQKERRNQTLSLHQQCEENLVHCNQQQKKSDATQESSEQLLSHWQQQKNIAKQRLDIAEQDLNRASAQLSQAEHDLKLADRALDSANANLRVARARPGTRVRTGGTDDHPIFTTYPPNCSYEEGAARSAHSQMQTKQRNHQSAVQRYQQANEALKQAKVQYQGTSNAVEHSGLAVELTHQGVDTANQANLKAQSALEHAQAQLQMLEKIESVLKELVRMDDEQSQTLYSMQQAFNESHIQLRELELQQESMQGEGFGLKYTLQDKISLLIAFDQALILS